MQLERGMLDLTGRGYKDFTKHIFLLSVSKQATKNPALCLLTRKQIQLKIFAQLSLQEMGNLLLFHGSGQKDESNNKQPPTNKMHVVKHCQRDQGLCIHFRKDWISLSLQAKEEEIPYSCSHSSQLLPCS